MRKRTRAALASAVIIAFAGVGGIGGATVAFAAAGDPYTTTTSIVSDVSTPLQVTYSLGYTPTATSPGFEQVKITTFRDGVQVGSTIRINPAVPAGHFDSGPLTREPGTYVVQVEVQVECAIVDSICFTVVESPVYTVTDTPPDIVYIEAKSPTRLGLADGSTEADYNTVVIPSAECVAYSSGGSTVSGNVAAPSSGTASSTCGENTIVTGGSWDLPYEAFSRSSTSTQRHDVDCESETIMEDTVLQQETRYVQGGQLTEWFAERPQITDTQEVAATPEELKAAECESGPGPNPDPSTDPDPDPNPNPGHGEPNNAGTPVVQPSPTPEPSPSQTWVDPGFISADVPLRPSDWSNGNFVLGVWMIGISVVGILAVIIVLVIPTMKRRQQG